MSPRLEPLAYTMFGVEDLPSALHARRSDSERMPAVGGTLADRAAGNSGAELLFGQIVGEWALTARVLYCHVYVDVDMNKSNAVRLLVS